MINALRAALLAALTFLGIAFAPAAFAAQGSGCLPTTGIVSGLTMTNDTIAAIAALISSNSGASAPATDCSAAPVVGQIWADTSVSGKIKVKFYDGANWLLIGIFDSTNHVWEPVTGGGLVNTVASAATTDPCSVDQYYLSITGTTTITSLGSNCVTGQVKLIEFAGALTLTHNATSLILPNNGSNITTAAGDMAEAVYLGSGNWRVVNYMPGAGACSTCARLNVADQTVSGGANVTAQSLTTGSVTIDCGSRPLQYITNNGAYTITAPSSDGSCMLFVTNGASAGATTFSGFTVGSSTGAALDTTNTHKFTISIWRINGTSGYSVFAHQ